MGPGKKELQRQNNGLEFEIHLAKIKTENVLKLIAEVDGILKEAQNDWRETPSYHTKPDSQSFWDVPRRLRGLVKDSQILAQRVKDLESSNHRLNTSLESEQQRSNSTFASEKRMLQDAHTREARDLRIHIQHLEGTNSQQLNKLRDDNARQVKGLQDRHNNELNGLQGTINGLRKEVDTTRTTSKAERDMLMSKHTTEQQTAKTMYDSKLTDLERKMIDTTTRLQAEHRKEIDSYSTALLARDDFKPMSDLDMVTQFQEISQDIDKLSRLEWRTNEEWTDQVLHCFTPNPRMLRKQILQDSIWNILHEYIFCSPFRVLGDEGKQLELQWNQRCGQDPQMKNGCYTWPKPSFETERWRYATVKECRAALRNPAPSEWDPRAILKKGFIAHVEKLTDTLTSALSTCVDVDKRVIQAIDNVIGSAANMWLEFGTQRCRTLIIVQGSNLVSVKTKLRQAQEGQLRLLTVAELRRYGNSKGSDLDIHDIVGTCVGKIATVSRLGHSIS